MDEKPPGEGSSTTSQSGTSGTEDMEESASETEMPECLPEFPVLQRSPLETSESTVSSDAESEVLDEEPGDSDDGGRKMGRQNVETGTVFGNIEKKFS